MAPADFDGDGSLKVAALGRRNGEDGRLQVFATTPPFDLLFEAEVGESATGLASGDFNEDGRPDLVVSLHSEARLVVLLQSRDPIRFERRNIEVTFRPEETGSPHTHSVRAVDINDDGHLDLLTAQAEWNVVLAMLGDGTGRFDEAAPLAKTGEHPYDVIVTTDGNGRRHLLTPNAQGSGLTLAAVPSAGTAPPVAPEDAGKAKRVSAPNHAGRREQALDVEPPRGVSTVACGLLDDDDQVDLVIGGYEAQSLAVYYNTLSAAAASKHDQLRLDQLGDHDLLTAPASFTAPRIADLDGDGRNEVFAACMSRRSIFVWSSNTDGEFGSSHKFDLAHELDCGGLDAQVVEVLSTNEGLILFAGGWNQPGIALLRPGGATSGERSVAPDRRER